MYRAAWIAPFLLLLCASVTSAQAPELTEIIKKVQDKYDNTEDFSASFEQTWMKKLLGANTHHIICYVPNHGTFQCQPTWSILVDLG